MHFKGCIRFREQTARYCNFLAFLVCALLVANTSAFALTATINSPANNTSVTPGQVLSISCTASNSVAGIQNIQLTRPGSSSYSESFNPSPPTTNVTRSIPYTVPSNATTGQHFTLTFTVTDYVDDPVNTSIDLISSSGGGGSPPANDNFANRITISGSNGSTTGANSNGTKETGEPSHAGDAGGKSVWWTWTAPATGSVTIDTFTSSFDTLLAVYTGTAVNALTTIASNDQFGGNQSQVTFSATSGVAYQIAVDGWQGASGNVVLTWVQDSSGISISGPIGGAVYDRLRDKLYVTNQGTNTVQVIDAATQTIAGGWPTQTNPRGLDISADRNLLVVANGTARSLTKIDLAGGVKIGDYQTTGANPDICSKVAFVGNDIVYGAIDYPGSGFEPILKYVPSTNAVSTISTSSLASPILQLASSDDKNYCVFGEGNSSGGGCYLFGPGGLLVSSSGTGLFCSNVALNFDGSKIIYNARLLNRNQSLDKTLSSSSKAVFLPYGTIATLTTGGSGTAAINVVSAETGNVVSTTLVGTTVNSGAFIVTGKGTKFSPNQEMFVVDSTAQKVTKVALTVPYAAADATWSLYE